MTEQGRDATLCTLLDGLPASEHAGAGLTFEADDGTRTSLSYGELADASRRVAGGFRRLGVVPGDRVLVHLPNCLEAVAIWLGLARLGAAFVPANTAFTARELEVVATRSEPVLAVSSAASAALLEEAGLSPAQLVLAGGGPGRPTVAELLASDPLTIPGPLDPGQPVELVFTSGTTSAPKAAIITHANCVFSGRQKAAAMGLTADDRLLSALPIVHVNAQSAFLAALTAGAPFVLLERYSAGRYCAQLAAHGATVTSLVGTQVRTMLRQERRDSDGSHGVRRAWFALNVTEPERAAFEERFRIRLYNGYGLTEAFTSVTQAPLEGPDRWPSVGRVLPGRELRIAAPDGSDVPAGTVGEIVVGGVPGRTIMAGYWRDPEATAEAIRDGWLHTGDLGRLDGEGNLYFVERKEHTIKRAGENIAAREVEEVLLEHPDVAEAGVVGVPDPIRDEAVKAFVVLVAGSTTNLEELGVHCAQRLAPFKVPTVWSLELELPRDSLGKVAYRRLREQPDRALEALR